MENIINKEENEERNRWKGRKEEKKEYIKCLSTTKDIRLKSLYGVMNSANVATEALQCPDIQLYYYCLIFR
jgi:hypothetical protein